MRRKILALLAAALVMVGLGVFVVASPAQAFFGWYNIKPYGTSKCLDVTDVSYANGAPLQLYDCLGGAQQNQVFTFVHLAGMPADYYQIKVQHSLKCLDVRDVSQSAGAVIQQWDCLGAGQTNQIFWVPYLGAGHYWLSPTHSGQYVSYQGLFNGAAVFQWPATADWRII